jgi:hypothetical protein
MNITHEYGDFIKIMSDGSELFVEDTECFLSLYPSEPDVYVRPTIDQFTNLIKGDQMGDFLGEHIIGEHESRAMSTVAGTRIWDLEWCDLREFYFEVEHAPRRLNRNGEVI